LKTKFASVGVSFVSGEDEEGGVRDGGTEVEATVSLSPSRPLCTHVVVVVVEVADDDEEDTKEDK